MVTNKPIPRMLAIMFITMFLLSGVLPAQARSLASLALTPDDLIWIRQMGGPSAEYSLGIAVDSNGNIYTTGEFTGTADFNPGAGTFYLTSVGDYSDIFISKLDNNGNFVWAKRMGGTGNDKGWSIAVDVNGNVYTTGTFEYTVDFDPGGSTLNLTSTGYLDVFVSKLDTNGNFVWARSMGGANSDDFGRSIALDSAGVYTTGYFNGTADFDPADTSTYNLTSAGQDDIFVSKLSTSGNFLWAKRVGGEGNDFSTSMVVNESGIFMTGFFSGTTHFEATTLISAGFTDIFVSQLNTSGGLVWAKRMGGLGYDKSNGIALDSDHNIYTTGSFEGTVDFGTGDLISAGFEDIFITKLMSNGAISWAKRMGGASGDSGSCIAVDANNNVYTTGVFAGTADFNPGTGTVNQTSAGQIDVYISKLDTFGAFGWVKRIGGTLSDGSGAIITDSSDNVYVTGSFEGSADFPIGNLTSLGSADIFVTRTGTIVYKYLYLPLIVR